MYAAGRRACLLRSVVQRDRPHRRARSDHRQKGGQQRGERSGAGFGQNGFGDGVVRRAVEGAQRQDRLQRRQRRVVAPLSSSQPA
ncbi:hypothetical protein HMPREF7215_1464 [Pyramidobacter piscolens W5455]|uniref:Uncharacterized protein n=1 Tax=Pyramidobacter piscolens W5455 TaxID=352165 RepID=A0ABM9ZSI8_9BACT|nr:hypothetical protein HMPREF7215_1464 [Pyramidobacter piscolens W5455]